MQQVFYLTPRSTPQSKNIKNRQFEAVLPSITIQNFYIYNHYSFIATASPEKTQMYHWGYVYRKLKTPALEDHKHVTSSQRTQCEMFSNNYLRMTSAHRHHENKIYASFHH